MYEMQTVVCPNCDRKHIIRKVDGMVIKNIRNPEMDNLLNFKPGKVIPFVKGYPCSPICGRCSEWPGFETAAEFDCYDTDRLEKTICNSILYHKVIDIDRDRHMLTLDNGVMLKFRSNDGCGGCVSGNYSITEFCPEIVDNAITNVKLIQSKLDPNKTYGIDPYRYEIFIYAEDKELKLLSCEGDDGNGCYGTGFHVYISSIIQPESKSEG